MAASFSILPESFCKYPVISLGIRAVWQELAGTSPLVSHICHAFNNACCKGHGSSVPETADKLWGLRSRSLHLYEVYPWRFKVHTTTSKLNHPGPSKTSNVPGCPSGYVNFQYTNCSWHWEIYKMSYSLVMAVMCATASWGLVVTVGEKPWFLHSSRTDPGYGTKWDCWDLSTQVSQ